MKLPKNIVEGALQIGEKKYALFTSFVLCIVEDTEQPSAVLFRPGEISCIITTPEATNPFEMETVPLIPAQIDATTVEEAVAILTEQLLTVTKRITEAEAADKATAVDCGVDPCGGNDYDWFPQS